MGSSDVPRCKVWWGTLNNVGSVGVASGLEVLGSILQVILYYSQGWLAKDPHTQYYRGSK